MHAEMCITLEPVFAQISMHSYFSYKFLHQKLHIFTSREREYLTHKKLLSGMSKKQVNILVAFGKSWPV